METKKVIVCGEIKETKAEDIPASLAAKALLVNAGKGFKTIGKAFKNGGKAFASAFTKED